MSHQSVGQGCDSYRPLCACKARYHPPNVPHWLGPVTIAEVKSAELPSRLLAEELRKAISTGALQAGDRLPSERSLAAAHGIARNTAREGIRLLAEQGLVTAEHGRGVFVRTTPRVLRLGAYRYSRKLRETGLSPYHAEVLEQGGSPSAVCASITQVTPPAYVAERLLLGPRDRTIRRENWYYANEKPIQQGVTYLPVSIGAGSPLADSTDLGDGDLYARFEDAGYTITSIREEVTARMPDRLEAEGLALPVGVPVLQVVHTGLDQRRRPFEVTRFVIRADSGGLDYQMAVED